MVVRITELPYGVDPSYLSVKSASVTTPLDQLDREREALAVSWWIIVLSVVAGVLLLLLLIYVLHKVSFHFMCYANYPKWMPYFLKNQNNFLIFKWIWLTLTSISSSWNVLSKVCWVRFDPMKRLVENGEKLQNAKRWRWLPPPVFGNFWLNSSLNFLGIKRKIVDLFNSYRLVSMM